MLANTATTITVRALAPDLCWLLFWQAGWVSGRRRNKIFFGDEEQDEMLGLLEARAWALSSAARELAANLFGIFGSFSTSLLGRALGNTSRHAARLLRGFKQPF